LAFSATEIGDVDNRARNIELSGAITRLFESIGVSVEENPLSKRNSPVFRPGCLFT